MDRIKSTYVGRREFKGGKVTQGWRDEGSFELVGRKMKGGQLIIGHQYELASEGASYDPAVRVHLEADPAVAPEELAGWELEDREAQGRLDERAMVRKHEGELTVAMRPLVQLSNKLTSYHRRLLRRYVSEVL